MGGGKEDLSIAPGDQHGRGKSGYSSGKLYCCRGEIDGKGL